MNMKDFVLIFVSLFLLAAVLLIGAKADFLKSKFGTDINPPVQEVKKPALDESAAGYNVSSENISISSPRPNQIIKGTVFKIEGQAKTAEAIAISIKDSNSNEAWLATTTQIRATQDKFETFEILVNASPHSGWAILEVSLLFSDGRKGNDSVSFPIRISASL